MNESTMTSIKAIEGRIEDRIRALWGCEGSVAKNALDANTDCQSLIKILNNNVLEKFKDHGMQASYHYADDTASGEWRMGSALEARALKLFDDNPDLQDEMRVIAKGFLWSLNVLRPDIEDEPEISDEQSLEEIARDENAVIDRLERR